MMSRLIYATANPYKIEEQEVFISLATLADGTPVREIANIEPRTVTISELLEVDLGTMVRAEVADAYQQLRVPCFVEHAGLVFEDYVDTSYPGGLTKPMWNTLQERFVTETHSSGRNVRARAAIGFCDGFRIHTFIGETKGIIASEPRGSREFYWDTVFIPTDPPEKNLAQKTYAEIVDAGPSGLRDKVLIFSQSTRAKLQLLEFVREYGTSQLWQAR